MSLVLCIKSHGNLQSVRVPGWRHAGSGEQVRGIESFAYNRQPAIRLASKNHVK